jgi:hypothetical protein
VPLTHVVADDGSGHPTLFIQEFFDAGLLLNSGAGRARGGKQLVVEDSTRDRKAGGPEWAVSGEGKFPMRSGTVGSRHFHAFERESAGSFEAFHYSEAGQDANRFRAHVFGARFVPGKCRAIYHEDGNAGPGQQESGGAAGGPGAGDEDIHLAGQVSQVTARPAGQCPPRMP